MNRPKDMKATDCRIDHVNNVIIISRRFAKAAEMIENEEFRYLRQIRNDNPTYSIQLRTIAKKEGKRKYEMLTYQSMEAFIKEYCGGNSNEMTDFLEARKFAKSQDGQYAYVKKWFLERFKDAYNME